MTESKSNANFDSNKRHVKAGRISSLSAVILILTSVSLSMTVDGIAAETARQQPGLHKADSIKAAPPIRRGKKVEESAGAGEGSDRDEGSLVGSAGATTVPLKGGVTRLDASASEGRFHAGVDTRRPLEGTIQTLIQTEPMKGRAHAESIPPERFHGWLQKAHPQFSLKASAVPSSAVVVVKGEWDNSSKTLDKMQIPHKRIGSGEIPRYDFSSTKVVIVDCSGQMTRAACQRLRDFVARGGYVLGTDWALDNFLSNTFNDYVRWNKGTNRGKIYDATVRDADPVLFNHAVTNAHWKLDLDTHLVRIVNRDAVRVLVTSSKLKGEDPDHEGVLALMFPFGRGYVLHMTGHYDNNAGLFGGNKVPDPAPVIGISLRQALATNFVVAGIEGRRLATRHSR